MDQKIRDMVKHWYLILQQSMQDVKRAVSRRYSLKAMKEREYSLNEQFAWKYLTDCHLHGSITIQLMRAHQEVLFHTIFDRMRRDCAVFVLQFKYNEVACFERYLHY